MSSKPRDTAAPETAGSRTHSDAILGTANAALETEFLIGDFSFVAATGELRCRNATQGASSQHQRLPPQPARLLALLIEKRGAIASHDEIRQRLWPDVAVDFEQGLHFCIRQVRAALGDQASSPKYIETLPRRGYRLLVPVTVPESTTSMEGSPEESQESSSDSDGSWWPGALAVFGFAAVFVGLLIAGRNALESPPAASPGDTRPASQATPATATPAQVASAIPSLAIMSFQAPKDHADLATERIADLLLARLGPLAPESLALIGPTTTERYGTDLHSVHRFTIEHPVDYVINGRFLDSEGGPGSSLIAELIRANDGAHVWVGVFEDLSAIDPVARQIGDGVIRFLELTE